MGVGLKRGVGTPFSRVPTSLHPWFRLKPKSNTKVLTFQILSNVKTSYSSRNPLKQSGLKTSRLSLLWKEDSRVTPNANYHTKRGVRKYHCWCHKQ